ncbi:MAG: OmpA family protein [Actinomycetota bacterium]
MERVFLMMLLVAPLTFINAQTKIDLNGKVVREADRRANQKTDQGPVQEKPDLIWAKFDFVPGEKVFFEDNHENEENGEFPARWDLVRGGGIENAVFDNHEVIYFRSGDALIVPYLENPKADYLPDVFTLEFDAWFEAKEYCYYSLKLFDEKNQPSTCNLITIQANAVYYKGSGGSTYPGEKYDDNLQKSYWRHISLAFNTRALKIYLDDTRLVNIPNLGCNPTGVTVGVPSYNSAGTKGINRFIKNIRIAEGGVKLYDRLLQDGKIIASGIRFEVNKATLRPESMGVINTIYQIMNEHPELRLSAEGHTDSDGDEVFNQGLSEQRAETVVRTLVQMGIDGSCLTSKGWGESKPLSDNSTPEGKANNRRVEFVKL